MPTIQQTCRFLLQSKEGKCYGIIENRTLYKRIHGSRHLLRKPPAIAIDADLYDRFRSYFDTLTVYDRETGRTYRLSAQRFDHLRWELERGYGRQYAVALRWWSCEPAEPTGQLTLEGEWNVP